jgi:hypothetical protein
MSITDNNLIEELLGTYGIICLEDIMDSFLNCHKPDSHINEVREAIWPIQLHPIKETLDTTMTKHEATGKALKKKNTKTVKGGYLGLMGDSINEFVAPLI